MMCVCVCRHNELYLKISLYITKLECFSEQRVWFSSFSTSLKRLFNRVPVVCVSSQHSRHLDQIKVSSEHKITFSGTTKCQSNVNMNHDAVMSAQMKKTTTKQLCCNQFLVVSLLTSRENWENYDGRALVQDMTLELLFLNRTKRVFWK